MSGPDAVRAELIRVTGIVQGVGFRPFVFRVANSHGITGWVLNDVAGVRIHAEGNADSLLALHRALTNDAPPAARVENVHTMDTSPAGYDDFRIAASEKGAVPTAGISPDLPVCRECLAELSNESDRRHGYEYINCTNCGPRYSIVRSLPYDRPNTTMAAWPMCIECAAEYSDPTNRRFHAQPNACPACGPRYALRDAAWRELARGTDAINRCADMLAAGRIVAIKGIGGYHLACDAANTIALAALRERKFRKERAFAVMVRDLGVARETIDLSNEAAILLKSPAHPIVVAVGRIQLDGVAPDTADLGVMLPYTPLHHLLFTNGAPARLVMTSANRSSEPIVYRDEDVMDRLSGIADAFMVGERPVARRVDDSVVRAGIAGTMTLRRSRGYAPSVVARITLPHPTLALGADLKNSVTLVIAGQAVMSQHIGDLDQLSARASFHDTIADLMEMYAVDISELRIVHDMHPEYVSSRYAGELDCASRHGVQHHRAHVASVLAEREEFDERVIGVAFDGTGYGDDGTIWGGEFFVGSVRRGLERAAHLRSALLPGGDAAARYPVQAAAGFLTDLDPDALDALSEPPFLFPERFRGARELVAKKVRCFGTTSAGRLFDTAAALLGFTRETTYEGQAAIWLEQLAGTGGSNDALSFPFQDYELDYRAAMTAIVKGRLEGRAPCDLARAFHRGLACGIADAVTQLAEEHEVRTAALSGGVFQNELLLSDVLTELARSPVTVWTNLTVPPNDGGISLGQAALTV
ncbi:MAG: carbamoyltransferase HypF [Gemmatimonadota bacterium]|nr:carbamoyltransferase HypF [Gemmatimonadota bacterium]